MTLEDLTNNPLLLKIFQRMTRLVGEDFQAKAPEMTADEIYDDADLAPAFNPTRHNYLEKKAGYVCRSPRGTMMRLIQPYDSTIYTQDPEDLPAQWGFYWSEDPARAKEFIQSATSPYDKGKVCLFEGEVYRSTMDSNVHSPKDNPSGWEKVEAESKKIPGGEI